MTGLNFPVLSLLIFGHVRAFLTPLALHRWLS